MPASPAASARNRYPLLPEIDPRGFAIDGHILVKVLPNTEPVLRHFDVLGQAELLTRAAQRSRRRGELVGRVAFDDSDLAGPAVARQMIGDRRADNAAADDQNVVELPISHALSPLTA